MYSYFDTIRHLKKPSEDGFVFVREQGVVGVYTYIYIYVHIFFFKELGPYTFSSLKEDMLVSSSGSVLKNLPFLRTCSLLSFMGL